MGREQSAVVPLAGFEPELAVFPSTSTVAGLAPLVCHTQRSPRRAEIETFVREQFLAHFDARVKRFMPELLALHDAAGAIRAVVGCRSAAHERLFLEVYTGEPIEVALARRLGIEVPRAQIVEIGSLACRSGRAAVQIVRSLVPVLLAAGFSRVVFTGASTVMNVFRFLHLSPRILCRADQALLGEARHDWGTYYDHDPHVMTGLLREGMAVLGARPRLQ